MNDQRSTTEQLRDLIGIANEHGLYDAADFCRREVERVRDKQAANEGHELMGRGAAYSIHGAQTGAGGLGHALCACGAMSPITETVDRRRVWHDDHLAAEGFADLTGRLDAPVTDAAGVEE